MNKWHLSTIIHFYQITFCWHRYHLISGLFLIVQTFTIVCIDLASKLRQTFETQIIKIIAFYCQEWNESVFFDENWLNVKACIIILSCTKSIDLIDHKTNIYHIILWRCKKYFIRMYWTIFWHSSAHVKLSILGKLLTKICSPDLFTSFGTFWVQIG